MKNLIVIDPGHGGADSGAVWDFTEEDDTNLSIAYLLRCELIQRGYIAKLTRERDVEMSLNDRTTFANNINADMFISIHCDAFHHETASGMSTHVCPGCSGETKELAKNIQAELVSGFPANKNRGVRDSDFYVLRHTKMPAILIECEFLSNPETRKFLKEPENQLDLAIAIADGVESI